MIVTCEECSTSFQLDEARIPPGGARVRCSRCKHAFFLPNPNEGAPQAVHAIAEEAAVDATAGTPAPSADLNDDTWDGLGGEPVSVGDASAAPTPPAAPPTAAPAAMPKPELDDEEDWQFSEEVRVEGDEGEEDLGGDLGEDFAADDGDLDFGEGLDFSEGFDESVLSAEVDGDAAHVPGPDEPEIASAAADDAGTGSGLEIDGPASPPTGEDPARDDSSFGSVDDFSSLMEDDDSPPGEAAASLASEIASELESESAEAGLYASRGQSDDLADDPESWDLVGSDDLSRTAAAAAKAAARSEPPSAAEFFNEHTFAEDPGELDLGATALATGPVGMGLRLIGWAAAATAVACVLALAFQAEWARFAPAPQTVSSGPLEAQTLDSGWVETARAGPILRFEGEVRNTAGQTIYPSAVQIALLDAAGARLAATPIRAGLPLPVETLREAAPEVLLSRASAATLRFARTPVAPGQTLRFEALVLREALPEDASRALLEVGPPQSAARPAPVGVGLPAGSADAARTAPESTAAVVQAERSSP